MQHDNFFDNKFEKIKRQYYMNHRQQEDPLNDEEDNISFDFWKTNYSGRLEKTLRLQ